MTRMFALDSFPYRNLTITDVEFENAKNRLSKFKVIGIQEAFDASARLLYKTFKVNIDDSLWKQNYDSKRMPLKSSIARSPKRYAKLQPHMEGTAAANEYDIKLYKWAVGKFCVQLCDAGLEALAKDAPSVGAKREACRREIECMQLCLAKLGGASHRAVS